MPNIGIYGASRSEAKALKEQIIKTMENDGEAKETVITTVVSECVDLGGNVCPYLVVACDNEVSAVRVATNLNKEMNVDVEVRLVQKFFPRT